LALIQSKTHVLVQLFIIKRHQYSEEITVHSMVRVIGCYWVL